MCNVVPYCSTKCQEYDFKRMENGVNWLQPGGHELFCEMFQRCNQYLAVQESEDEYRSQQHTSVESKEQMSRYHEDLTKLTSKYLNDGPSKILTRKLSPVTFRQQEQHRHPHHS